MPKMFFLFMPKAFAQVRAPDGEPKRDDIGFRVFGDGLDESVQPFPE